MTEDEIIELYSYKNATCKIRFEILKEGNNVTCYGIGYFSVK